jgi:DNA repair protein RadC
MASSRERKAAVAGPRAARLLDDMSELTRSWLRERAACPRELGNEAALIDYLRAVQAFAPSEQMRVLFLNARNMLIRDELMGQGTLDEVPLWPREVLRRSLELNAAGVILVHNHPSGDHAPSEADVRMTLRFASAARELGVLLHDHYIFSPAGHSSFRALGLL